MFELPDPDWYLDNVLVHAQPGRSDPVVVGPVVVGPARQWRSWWAAHAASDDPVVRSAAHNGFVLSAAELATAGVTRARRRTEVRRERWFLARQGWVCPLDLGGSGFAARRRRHAARAAACVRARAGTAVSGASATVLHGLPTLRVPEQPELTALASRVALGPRPTGRMYGATLGDADIAAWHGLPVTTVARTLVDLARHDRRSGLMAADAALREQLTTIDEIDAAVRQAAGWPGVRQARAVLALADHRAESPLESLTRLALHDSGLPKPDLQVVVDDRALRRSYRVDMLLESARLVLEADGRVKYAGHVDGDGGADPLWQEKAREVRLRALGYRVERLVWDDVVRRWPATEARLRALLRR